MRGQSHLHIIMSVTSCDSHESSHWWNRVVWHGAAQFTALSGWHRCQSLCSASHFNLSTRLKWAKTAAVQLPSGCYVDWKSSDEIFQMCVNSICAFLTHPSLMPVSVQQWPVFWADSELFIEWSLSLSCASATGLLCTRIHTVHIYSRGWSMEDHVWVCWDVGSYPDTLQRFYLRSSIFNVVVPKEYHCKYGSISNSDRWLSKGLYYEEVGIVSGQLREYVLSL